MATTDFHEIWNRYGKSKKYLDSKGLVVKTEKNWLMYTGKQWEAVNDSSGMEDLPMLNFIKPTVKYKVSSITSSHVTAMFSDLNGKNNEPQEIQNPITGETTVIESVVSRMNALFDISREKAKMQKCEKKGLKQSAVQGDSYFFWGEGGDTRKPPQLLHNTQVRLGDENTVDLQEQPWIIIEERLDPKVVKERARLAGIPKKDIDLIQPDKELDNSLINKNEVDEKVTCLLYMEKDTKSGIVWLGRCTPNVMYEKMHPVQQYKAGEYTDLGLTKYPIIPMIWEETPNDARGIGEVEQLIPNQLEANKMLARRAISAKMTAFPRVAYDETALANPEDLDKVGATLKVNGGNAQAISNMIAYLAPQAMSGDAKQLTDDLIGQSRTLAGASDVQLGNIDLSRVSGTAAMTIRDQQQVPLNEQQEMYQDFIENTALLWFELWKVYYPDGIEMDGITVTAEELASVTPNVRVDIVEDTSVSKMGLVQELVNLLNNNKISFEEFANMYPDHATLPKDVLKQIAETRKEMMQMGQMPTDEMGNPLNDGLGNGVNVGGASSGSYQSLQSQLAQ